MYLNFHRNNIDDWVRDNYDDGRTVDQSNDYDGLVQWTVDANDDADATFPADIAGVEELVKTKTPIIQLSKDLKDGSDTGFYRRLRKHLDEIDAVEAVAIAAAKAEGGLLAVETYTQGKRNYTSYACKACGVDTPFTSMNRCVMCGS